MNAKKVQPRSRFSLSTLLFAITLVALLVAWYVDREELLEQIPAQPTILNKVYQLQYASAEVVSEELNEMFKTSQNRFVQNEYQNSVIALIEENSSRQVDMIIRHMDRRGTEFAQRITITVCHEPQVAHGFRVFRGKSKNSAAEFKFSSTVELQNQLTEFVNASVIEDKEQVVLIQADGAVSTGTVEAIQAGIINSDFDGLLFVGAEESP
ncbi:MAG: hypothetical protein AAGA30_21580 [Planctomycetota bacterium]